MTARGGAAAFSGGRIARGLGDRFQTPPLAADASQYVAEAALRPGKMVLADLAAYQLPAISPTRVRYRGYDIYSTPPPESGGSPVTEALNILQGLDLSGSDRVLARDRLAATPKLAFR